MAEDTWQLRSDARGREVTSVRRDHSTLELPMRFNLMRQRPLLPTRRNDLLPSLAAALILVAAFTGLPQVAFAEDMVLTTPDGRKVVLKDDNTWAYQDEAGSGKPQPVVYMGPQAALQLLSMTKRGSSCVLAFRFTNNLPYEIRHIVPYFAVTRANGVVHDTISAAFLSIRPSDAVEQSAEFSRIACDEIMRVQVIGGDRCEMDDLTKFSEANGQCLARVRVVGSDLVKFEK